MVVRSCQLSATGNRYVFEAALGNLLRGREIVEAKGNQGRTLDRALDVLESVTNSREPVSLTDISKMTGLHIATTQRLVGQLVGRDYLQGGKRGYTLGPKVLPMSHAYVLQDRLALIAPGLLSMLTAQTGLTSSVFVRVKDTRVLVARIEAPNPLSYQFPVGQVLSLFFGGGKVLLAHAEPQARQQLLDEYSPIRLENGRIQDLNALQEDLEAIRRDGYLIAESERNLGAMSITAPIWSPDMELLGSLNLVAEHGEMDREGLFDHRAELLRACRKITAQM